MRVNVDGEIGELLAERADEPGEEDAALSVMTFAPRAKASQKVRTSSRPRV